MVLSTIFATKTAHHQLALVTRMILVLTLLGWTVEDFVDVLVILLEIVFQFLNTLSLVLLLIFEPLNLHLHLLFFQFFSFFYLSLVLVRYKYFDFNGSFELLDLLFTLFTRLSSISIWLNISPSCPSIYLSLFLKRINSLLGHVTSPGLFLDPGILILLKVLLGIGHGFGIIMHLLALVE